MDKSITSQLKKFMFYDPSIHGTTFDYYWDKKVQLSYWAQVHSLQGDKPLSRKQLKWLKQLTQMKLSI